MRLRNLPLTAFTTHHPGPLNHWVLKDLLSAAPEGAVATKGKRRNFTKELVFGRHYARSFKNAVPDT